MMNKIQSLIIAIKQFKNWYIVVKVYFKKIKNEHVIIVTRNGLKIKIRTNSTDIMQLGTVWLTKDYSTPGFQIKDNDVVIDIGGHIGLFALFASLFCKVGKIYCIEPIKSNYEMLVENIFLNKIKNIIPLNFAVTKNDDGARIYLNVDDSAHSIFQQGNEYVNVKSISLKSFFDNYQIVKCDLMKIDCEGAEYEIIDSIPELYLSKINKIIIEYHDLEQKKEEYQKLLKKLESSSFNIKIKKDSENLGVIYASKQI